MDRPIAVLDEAQVLALSPRIDVAAALRAAFAAPHKDQRL